MDYELKTFADAERTAFGAHLLSLRLAKRLSRRQVEKMTTELNRRISEPYLAQVEKGLRNPPSRRAVKMLAELYGADVSDLWTRAGYEADGKRQHYHCEDDAERTRLNAAFEAAKADPDFFCSWHPRRSFGEHGWEEQARFIVALYEQSTGKKIFSEPEKTK